MNGQQRCSRCGNFHDTHEMTHIPNLQSEWPDFWCPRCMRPGPQEQCVHQKTKETGYVKKVSNNKCRIIWDNGVESWIDIDKLERITTPIALSFVLNVNDIQSIGVVLSLAQEAANQHNEDNTTTLIHNYQLCIERVREKLFSHPNIKTILALKDK